MVLIWRIWYWNREVRILSLPWHSTVLVLHFQKFQKFTLILKSLWKLHFSTWSDLQCFFQRPWPFFLRSTLQQNYIFCSKIRHNSKPNGWFLTRKFKYYIQLKPDNGFGFGTKIQIDEFPQLAANGFFEHEMAQDHSVYMFGTFHLLIYLFEYCSGRPLFVSFIGIWWSSIMPKRAAEGELHPLQSANQ